VDVLGVHVAKVGDGSETHTVSEPTTGAGELTSVAPLTNHPKLPANHQEPVATPKPLAKINPT